MEMGLLLAPLYEDTNPCLPGLRVYFILNILRDRSEENLMISHLSLSLSPKDPNGIIHA